TYFEWCTFGEAYLEAGALDQAENCYKQALKIAPSSEYAKSGVIRCNMRAGNYDEAKQIAADAMKLTKDKDHYNYYKNLYMAASEASLRGSASSGARETPASLPSPVVAKQAPTEAHRPSAADEAALKNLQNIPRSRGQVNPGGGT